VYEPEGEVEMKRRNRWSGLVLAGLIALLCTPGPAAADEMASEAGMGALAGLSTLLYAPVKLVYATAGVVFGGIAWGLSGGDSEVMMAVMTPAVRGDYVITPKHLRMEEPIEFFGQDPAYRDADAQQLASEEPISSEDF
jgi:hypothetical protein